PRRPPPARMFHATIRTRQSVPDPAAAPARSTARSGSRRLGHAVAHARLGARAGYWPAEIAALPQGRGRVTGARGSGGATAAEARRPPKSSVLATVDLCLWLDSDERFRVVIRSYMRKVISRYVAVLWLLAALSLIGWLLVNLDTAGWILVILTVG